MTPATRSAPEPPVGPPTPVAVALLAPVLAAVTLLVGFVLWDAAGSMPLTYSPPRNLAEAAGVGSGAAVLRFLRAGEDPNVVAVVRPEIISSAIRRVTPLEAAIWGREIRLLQLLLDQEGVDADRQYLACLADALSVEDLVPYLAPNGLAPCDADTLLRQIEARRP